MSQEEKKLSGAMRIFEALSNVDEELLIKCEEEKAGNIMYRRRRKWSKAGVMRYAATLTGAACVVIVCIALWRNNGFGYIAKDSASSENCAVAISEEKADVAEEPAASAEAAVAGGETADANREAATAAGKDAGEAMPEAAPEAAVEQANGTEDSGAIKQGSTLESGIQDLYQGIESAEKEKLETSIDSAGTMKDKRVDIPEAEARQLATIGKYIPTVLPTGYTWESGKTYAEEDAEDGVYVSVNWVRGMDSISLIITAIDADEIQLTDVAARETYDVHLYEIPYAQTVPEEYRESFHSPVFAATDFTKEVVEARMKSVADQGDTDTPRGQFSVLYEDGVLIRFSGRGTAEEIWEMFQSIQ